MCCWSEGPMRNRAKPRANRQVSGAKQRGGVEASYAALK